MICFDESSGLNRALDAEANAQIPVARPIVPFEFKPN
jgi:hypothetical protein